MNPIQERSHRFTIAGYVFRQVSANSANADSAAGTVAAWYTFFRSLVIAAQCFFDAYRRLFLMR